MHASTQAQAALELRRACGAEAWREVRELVCGMAESDESRLVVAIVDFVEALDEATGIGDIPALKACVMRATCRVCAGACLLSTCLCACMNTFLDACLAHI